MGMWCGGWGRWRGLSMVEYVFVDAYYECGGPVVGIVEGHWQRPGVVFVPPPAQVRVIEARPGIVVVPPPPSVRGAIMLPPPGTRVGVVVQAPMARPRTVAVQQGRAVVPPPPYRPMQAQ